MLFIVVELVIIAIVVVIAGTELTDDVVDIVALVDPVVAVVAVVVTVVIVLTVEFVEKLSDSDSVLLEEIFSPVVLFPNDCSSSTFLLIGKIFSLPPSITN